MNARLRITCFAALATALGSLSLLPIFDTYGWVPRVALLIGAVAVTAAVFQRIRVLSTVAPLAMALVWAALITALYAHTVAPLGFVPGPAALRVLHATLSSGFTDTTQLAAPVDVTRGLSLMTTGGVGLVAVVVQTLAGSLRRPAIAGLPLLAIFTVPAAIISKGVGWPPFVLAAAGFLALLLAEGRERIVRWGRPVRSSPPPSSIARVGGQVGPPPRQVTRSGPATGQLTQVGRRVGFTAISIAVVVPIVVPGLHSGWFGTYRTNGTAGIGTKAGATSISPIIAIQHDLTEPTAQPLFTYTTTGTPSYLRLLTLDKFDGTQWTVSSVTTPNDTKIDKGIPPTPGLTLQPSGTAETDVTVSGGLRETYLPTPLTPVTVKAHGDWRYNAVNPAIYSPHDTTIHLAYKVTSAVYDPTAAELNALPAPDADTAALQADLTTPTNLPDEIAETADSIVERAGAVTPYQKALALQTWFQAGTYNINVNLGTDNNALLTFVRNRVGYCQQFAATMALMARLEGIPARVDVGFTPGSQIGSTGVYQVTTADAHAWPELYFQGAGWLRFEPTPRADGQTTRPAYANTTLAPQPSASASGSTTSNPSATSGPDVKRAVVKPAANSSSGASSGERFPVGWVAASLVALLALAIAPLTRRTVRRRRWTAADTEAARAHAAWDELGDDLRDLRLPWRGDDDTPRRAAATLLASRQLAYDPTAQQALARLGRAEELARYSARPDDLRWVDQDPRTDEETVRRALFGSVSPARRLRAHLAPSSTWRVATFVGSSISDGRRAASQRLVGLFRRDKTTGNR
jgi:transglutaminase-like putative cysteine protease